MAVAEDAASVLEQFVQDVANLPAEIQHLLEEIEAKDKTAAECRTAINQRDMSLQRHCKASGASTPNPKEDNYNKTVMLNYDKAQALQEEKILLSEKARILLDRQIKRLDLQIRGLENSGILPPDPLLPSILHNSPGNRLPPVSSSTTGTNTPLAPIPGNSALPSTSIANAAIQRLVTSQTPSARVTSPTTTSSAGATTPTSANPTSASLSRSQRESSLDAKRRRLNAPAQSSSLRQSSLGPSASVPKVSTPTHSVRGGSAGPRASMPAKKFSKIGSNLAPPVKGSAKKASGRRKGRKGVAGIKASLSDTGEDSALSEDPGSETEGRRGTPVVGDVVMGGVEEEVDEEGDGDGDDRKYCTCKAVSYGNMVACDNDDCPYEWFHWSCVGMTKEPVGKWYCEECKAKLGIAK